MLFISFVVAVPVSQLRASPRKGSKLLLQQMCICGWLDCNNFIADIMVVLPELYISSMFESSTCSVTVVEFGLMAAVPENVVVVVS